MDGHRRSIRATTVSNELCDLSAVDMLAGYRAKRFSPSEVMDSVQARIARREPVVKALWAAQPERAIASARESTDRWAAGTPCGPLDGVPYTLKENIATAGTPVPLGTKATELVPAPVDAPPAARAREAGGILLGKTTMPDLGMLSSGLSSFHDLTSNPWNPAWNPGGSSAGGGAAAAAGYGPLHLGTDIGGSLRLPASWNAIVSLKPSNGRIAINPPFFGRVAGPMSRTVADNALFMSVLAQFDTADYMALPPADIDWMSLEGFDPHGKRIALHLDAGAGMPVESETRLLIERAAQLFGESGATIVEIPPFFSQHALDDLDLFWRVRGWVDYLAMAPGRRDLLLPFISEWVHGGRDVAAETLMRCVNRKLEVRKLTQQATEPFDLVLSPVSPVPTYPVDWPMPSNDVQRAMDHIAFTVPYNMSEQPAISINAGFTEAGKAVGLQISGRRFADRDVLAAASWFESHRPDDAVPDWTIPSIGR
jgi:aspartyl-tRNA(Asn)/glutamyl-tRNA(Gln) amidotransferase subunit A